MSDELFDDFWTRLRAGEALDCPCCGRFAKVYIRPLDPAMVLGLAEAYRVSGLDLFDAPAVFNQKQRTFTTTKYWGLVKQRPDANEPRVPPLNPTRKQETTSYWQVTPLGEKFLKRRAIVKRRCVIWDDQPIEKRGGWVNVRNVLRQPGFDLSEYLATTTLNGSGPIEAA